MSGKFALIIANTEYADPRLAKLTAPGEDAEAFAQLLKSPDLASFDDVITLLNQGSYDTRLAIAQFLVNRKSDDLLLLYFSGHGVRDEQGRLFLATKDTNNSILDATAIPAEFVTRAMDNCRSKRQILILDCCNSGAFAYGTKAPAGASMGTASAFEGNGYGRVVLTATDATQFAYEGNRVIGEATSNSLFTHFLIKGLEGEADADGDERITVDELYDYASEQIRGLTPNQKPEKFVYHQQEKLTLTTKVKPQTIKPAPLDPELEAAVRSNVNYVRKAGVEQLGSIINGINRRQALTAEQMLKAIAETDDSLTIRGIARQIINDFQSTKAARPAGADTSAPSSEEPQRTSPEAEAGASKPKAYEEIVSPILGQSSSGASRLEAQSTSAEVAEQRLSTGRVGERQRFRLVLGGIASLVVIAIIVSIAMIINRPGREAQGSLTPIASIAGPSGIAGLGVTGTGSPMPTIPTQVVAPTSPATGTTTQSVPGALFADDFRDGFSQGWGGDLSSWVIVDGKAYPKNIFQGGTILAGNETWKDYTVAVTTTSSTGSVTSYLAAIYVHYQDSNNFVRFMFNCDFPATTIEWTYSENGKLSSLAKSQLSACVLDHYSIKITIQGSQYKAAVEGDELSVQLGNVLSSGMIGLYSIENGGNAAAAFSNLVVSP